MLVARLARRERDRLVGQAANPRLVEVRVHLKFGDHSSFDVVGVDSDLSPSREGDTDRSPACA